MSTPLFHTDLANGVLQTLEYFDHFRYPLNEEEIHRFVPVRANPEELLACLRELREREKIICQGGFIALPGKEALFERRRKSNALAATLLPKAHRVGRFISGFPFVRFVGISGSLSKLYADKNTDFDFFILTAPGRLWIARTILHVMKKLSFLFNRQKYFCMNYFLDEAHLSLEDRNRYTAIELATLIPVSGASRYLSMIRANPWLSEEVPNFIVRMNREEQENRPPVQRMSEFVLNLLNPRKLNLTLMHLTDRKWRRKWARHGYTERDYELAFRTRPYISKNHPKNYQKIVLNNLKKTNYPVSENAERN